MYEVIEAPRMLLVGSTGRNTGKTALAMAIIANFRHHGRLIGLKVSTIYDHSGTCIRGGEGCGVCTSLEGHFALTEEVETTKDKDTAKLLSAGARKVYWLRAGREHLAAGYAEFQRQIKSTDFIICESNSIRTVVKPGLFLMTTRDSARDIKASAHEVLPFADRVVTFDGDRQNISMDDIHCDDDGFCMHNRVSALILAGGNSTRMGTDKALLDSGGITVIERVFVQLRDVFPEVIISANDPAKYSFLGAEIVTDKHRDAGPIAGISAGLEICANPMLFVIACDIPHIDIEFVRSMVAASEEYDVVVPISGNGHYEPLHAIYGRKVLRGLAAMLTSKNYKIINLYKTCRILAFPMQKPIPNINTRDEFDAYTRDCSKVDGRPITQP